MEVKRINIGFIGCGRVSENHYKAIRSCPNAQLIALSDLNKVTGYKKAKEWGVDFYENPEELLNSRKIDAIFILTPLESHYYYAKKAIINRKHVLVEKPVSLNPREIKELEVLSIDKNVVCMPGHSYLYLPEISRMIKLLENGLIGKPIYMFMSEVYCMPLELIKLYHGPLIEILWHSIYVLIALLGIPSKIVAFASCLRKEIMSNVNDHGIVNARFDSGALAQIFISWVIEDETSDPWTFKLKVLGTDGCINFSRKDVVNEIMENKPPWGYPLYDEMFEKEVDYFINSCILGNKRPLSPIKDAFYTSIILNAVEQSVLNNKVIDIDEYINCTI